MFLVDDGDIYLHGFNICLLCIGIVFGGRVYHFTLASSLLLLYLALLSSAAFSLWNLLLKYNKVGSVSFYNFLTPIFGAILSSIFLRENILEYKNAVALTLVCIGIWIVNKRKNDNTSKLDINI